MKVMGVDIQSFDFMDPPLPHALTAARDQLYSLGALDVKRQLTVSGRIMAEFPMDPPLSKMLLATVDLGCSDEILSIIAMIIKDGYMFDSKMKRSDEAAEEKMAQFFQPESDYLTFLAIYEECKAHNFSEKWCFENFISYPALRRTQDVRNQLISLMGRCELDLVSSGRNSTKIREAITAGFFFNAAKKNAQGGYRTLIGNQTVYINCASSLFERESHPEWVIFRELVVEAFMIEVTEIDPNWLPNHLRIRTA